MLVLFGYLFYFTAASASPLQRRWLATKHDGGGQTHFAFKTMLFLSIAGLTFPFFATPYFSGNLALLIALGLIAGVSGGGYFISNYTAQRYVDAGITNLIVNIYTPVTILIATLFLNESLRPTQILGTMILLFAMVLVSKKHRIGRFKFDKYFLMMIMSGVLLGVCLSAERALMKTTGFTTGVLMSWWSQAIALGVLTLILKSRTTYSTKDTLITGALKFLQALSWVLLLQIVGNLSVVSAITTFKVVVIFIVAALFLKEREDLTRKTIGSLVAVLGLLLMK